MQGYTSKEIKEKVPRIIFDTLKEAIEKYEDSQKAYGKCKSQEEFNRVDDWNKIAQARWESANKMVADWLGEEWPFI